MLTFSKHIITQLFVNPTDVSSKRNCTIMQQIFRWYVILMNIILKYNVKEYTNVMVQLFLS